MNVTFGTVSKRTNSTAQPTVSAKTVDCQIKAASNIETPQFTLSVSDFSPSYNYAVIPTWGRRYFVSDYVVETGGRVVVSLSEDYGGTWASLIKESSQFVVRSASAYNTDIADGEVRSTYAISSGAQEITIPAPYSALGVYVLRVANKDAGTTGGIATYLMSQLELNNTLSYIFSQNVPTDEAARAIYNPFKYVISLMWIPVQRAAFQREEKTSTVVYGDYETDVEARLFTKPDGVEFSIGTLTLPANVYSDWRAYDDSFSQYTMYLPGVGTVPVSAHDLHGGASLSAVVDGMTGQISWRLTNTSGKIISTYKGMYGVQLQIGNVPGTFYSTVMAGSPMKSNGAATTYFKVAERAATAAGMDPMGSNVTQLKNISLANTIAAGAVAAGDALVAPFKAVANAGISFLGAINAMADGTESVNGNMGNMADAMQNNKVVISLLNFGSTPFQTATVGRPLYEYKTLSTLSGFTLCAHPALALPGAYAGEQMAVNQMLESGIYIE